MWRWRGVLTQRPGLDLTFCPLQVISIPDDDEKSPSEQQEEKKNGEEPMETDKPSNGEAENGEKEKDGEGEKKSPGAEEEDKSPPETKTETSEVKAEEPEVKGQLTLLHKHLCRFMYFLFLMLFLCFHQKRRKKRRWTPPRPLKIRKVFISVLGQVQVQVLCFIHITSSPPCFPLHRSEGGEGGAEERGGVHKTTERRRW